MVWAGANLGSYAEASAALESLCGVAISPRRIRRAVERIGQQRLQEREQAVAQYEAMPIPERQVGSQAVEPPQLGVISIDGGRYQRRDHFGQGHSESRSHWRETKVGCLLSMSAGQEQAEDPAPELPAWLLHSEAVSELARTGEMDEQRSVEETVPAAEELGYRGPQLLSREVLASGADGECFAKQLASRAWQRGFPRARRLAFVSDGAHVNWEIHKRYFPRAVGILDLMHALSYAYAAARAIGEPERYARWARWIWSGQVDLVIEQLGEHQAGLGLPPAGAAENDPRVVVDRARTYYTNNRLRMNYPEYRRQGLPLTSSHVESTIKQINRRVKGTEKFWSRDCGEAVLQLRADYLSDSQPLRAFWRRYQANQTGSNAYRQST